MTRPKPPAKTAAFSQEAMCRLADVLALAEEESIALDHPAVTAFGDAVARYVRSRDLPSPGRGAASWVREQLKQAVCPVASLAGRPVAHALSIAVSAGLKRIASAIPSEDRGAAAPEVADRLAIPFAELQDMLRTRVGRQALWYPMHTGQGQFRWMRPWLMDPAIQAARCAAGEPRHPVALPAEFEGSADDDGPVE